VRLRTGNAGIICTAKEVKGKGYKSLALVSTARRISANSQKMKSATRCMWPDGWNGIIAPTRKQAGALPFTVLISGWQGSKSYLGRLKMNELRADIAKFSAEKAK
jgi:hypothetical protein